MDENAFMRALESIWKVIAPRWTTEDEMAGLHHRLDGHEFGWTLGVGDEQGGLACCNSWGHKKSDMTKWLNWTDAHIEAGGIWEIFVPSYRFCCELKIALKFFSE